ncbi:unnamed protein product [Jaminaea pallidilutea]
MYTHIVSFKFASHVTDATRDEVHSRMTALNTECKLDGGKGATYIASLTGGKKNISPEGKGHGFDNLYVLTFTDPAHVPYYLDHDPAHVDFKNFVGPLLQDAFIYDYE